MSEEIREFRRNTVAALLAHRCRLDILETSIGEAVATFRGIPDEKRGEHEMKFSALINELYRKKLTEELMKIEDTNPLLAAELQRQIDGDLELEDGSLP